MRKFLLNNLPFLIWLSLARSIYGVPDVGAQRRLLGISIFFCLGFIIAGVRVSQIALSNEPHVTSKPETINPISSARADIVDRHGRILATNVESYTAYAHPAQMIAPARAATELAKAFSNLEHDALYQLFTSSRNFTWVIRDISPEDAQVVHDIGEPGLLIAVREKRFYPNGAIAAHLLGGVSTGREGVTAVETLGSAGLEKYFDFVLKDKTRAGLPLELSIDLAIQLSVEEVLERVVQQKIAKGAAAIVMKPETGEILALSSAPDFDPNNHSAQKDKRMTDVERVNIAVEKVFEPESLFNVFTFAKAVDLAIIEPGTSIPIDQNLVALGFRVEDYVAASNNPVTNDAVPLASVHLAARLGLRVGPQQLRTYFQELGFLDPLPLELSEAASTESEMPNDWSDTLAMYLGAGHEFSVSLVHLAQAYSALANDGQWVPATLLKRAESDQPGPILFSAQTARIVRNEMRTLTQKGGASFGDIAGYDIAASIGTSRKSSKDGSDQADEATAIFAAMFPFDKPRYVLLVVLDEPLSVVKDTKLIESNIVPASVGREVLRRVAPLLYVKPKPVFE